MNPDQPRKSVFASAVDWWLAILLMAGPVILAVMTAMMLQQGRQRDALYCLAASALTLAVTAMFTIPCRYTILTDSLSIRCGILFFRVPFDQIKSVDQSGSWLSGPALSLKRVKIKTASRFYLISPADRERFMKELEDAIAA